MTDTGRWSDLTARLGSALVMLVVGVGVVWAGGLVFAVFLAAVCGAMMWELVRMLAPQHPQAPLTLGVVAAVALMLAFQLNGLFVFAALAVPVLTGLVFVSSGRVIFCIYGALILLAGYGMGAVRAELGIVWLIWLMSVVIASDVAGYFAGKAIGGPKFWPRVSPKKTWSGTVAGWVGAGVVGLVFSSHLHGYGTLVILSVAVAMAAQAGDIAESAIKRRANVKDSSALIPGHGGVLDRFDGMLGASVLVLLLMLATGAIGGVGL